MPSHPTARPPGDAPLDEAAVVLAALHQLVEPLAALIPGTCEVVLHDLRRMPHSIVAIAGDLSGRTVGGPATDLLLRAHESGSHRTAVGYGSRDAGGRELRSSTVVFRDSAGTPVATLCVNSETQVWHLLAGLASSMLPGGAVAAPGAAPAPVTEEFLGDVDQLAQHVLSSAIAATGVPVELMHKRHKTAVVRSLKERGFFQLKDGVETAAAALGVTRFTIYNYLNELHEPGAPAADD